MAKEINPRLVFERLFMIGSEHESAAARAERLARRRSILDYVRDDATRLRGRLGTTDRRKLEEYFDGLRTLERRLDQVERVAEDPEEAANMPRPAGRPKDYREHLKLMGDLIIMAFRLDLTRVATFMIANEGSNRSFPFLDIADGHHHLSHHGGNKTMIEGIRKINRFQSEALADLLDRFTEIERDGSRLIDSTMIVWGGAISDGNRHNHNQLPVLVAGGRDCGMQTGRHVVLQRETPMSNLHLGLVRKMGLEIDAFGDSTGWL